MGHAEHAECNMPRINPPFIIGDQSKPETLWRGLNTAAKDSRFILPGETSDSLNWVTGRNGDHIALRRGQALLGTTRRAISGNKTKVTGIGVGTKIDGTQVPFFSAGRSLYHYDATDDDTYEDDTVNILPEAADGEDTNFNPYTNLAGSFMYVTSQNSPTYKIPVANPGSAVDQKSLDYRFGFTKINRNRMYGMNRKGVLGNSFDATGVYLSWIDRQTFGDYTAPQTNLVQGSGDGATKAFSGSSISGATSGGIITYFSVMFAAPIQAGTAITGITQATSAVVSATSHGLSYGDRVMILGVVGMTQINGVVATVTNATNPNAVTISVDSSAFTAWSSGGTIYKVEVFTDDRSGNLNSDLGGTGTINYATGAWSLTFNTAPINLANCIICNVSNENATSEGVLDFSYNSSSRTPGTGNLFRQDDGGGVGQALWSYQGVEYCFHKLRSWVLSSLDTTDTLTSNLPYYENIGIPYPRAVFPTGDGIIFLNNANPADPKVSILQIPPGSTNLTVVPQTMSAKLDLTGFAFDYAVVYRFGEYDIMECQKYTNGIKDTYNSVTFVRNIFSGAWDKLDYAFTCLAEYGGALIGGDSLSPNVYTLFSGFDDDGEIIPNYRNSSATNFGLEGLKKVGYLNVQGLIQPSQRVKVSISLDGAPYVEMYTIDGSATYVLQSNPVGVGSFTLGTGIVGGGGGEVTANEFEVDIPLHTDKFDYISFRVEALDVGYVQINTVAYKDIRFKRRRLLSYNDPEIS